MLSPSQRAGKRARLGFRWSEFFKPEVRVDKLPRLLNWSQNVRSTGAGGTKSTVISKLGTIHSDKGLKLERSDLDSCCDGQVALLTLWLINYFSVSLSHKLTL